MKKRGYCHEEGRPFGEAGFQQAHCSVILVSMTRIRQSRRRATSRKGQWALQDAKARFSEVVRKAKTEGPQRITVHGREEVVVVSVEEYRRVKGERTGQALVQALQASPLRDITIDHEPTYAPVRGVEL